MVPEEVHVGIDLGQRVDASAIVVCTVEQRLIDPPLYDTVPPSLVGWGGASSESSGRPTLRAKTEGVFRVVYAERMLGVSYPDQVRHIVQILAAIREQQVALRQNMPEDLYDGLPPRVVYLDATGCGVPVQDMLATAIAGDRATAGCSFFPLMFTSGFRFDKWGRPAGTLGKSYLVSRLEALSQARPTRIKIPDPRDRETGGWTMEPQMARDIEAMLSELHLYHRVVSQDGHDSYSAPLGQHDDLCVALGLATIEDVGASVSYGTVHF